MKIILLVFVLCITGCSRSQNDIRRDSILGELPWINQASISEGKNVHEWSSIFPNAFAYELRTSAEGDSVWLIPDAQHAGRYDVFYDCRKLSPKGRGSVSDFEKLLDIKVQQFNSIVPVGFYVNELNKYTYAVIVSRLLFQGHYSGLDDQGIRNFEATELKISFVNGMYRLRLFHSLNGDVMRQWEVWISDAGLIDKWSVISTKFMKNY